MFFYIFGQVGGSCQAKPFTHTKQSHVVEGKPDFAGYAKPGINRVRQ